MVVVLVGGSAGWRKLRLLQCLLSQLQIDGGRTKSQRLPQVTTPIQPFKQVAAQM